MDHTSAGTSLLPLPWLLSLLLPLLLLTVPIVVCMPLTSDTVLYDLQAQTVLQNGTLYGDILEPNLPGIVWLHLLIRAVGGWSSEWIRLVDLLIVGAACWLLSGWWWTHSPPGPVRFYRSWVLLLLSALFYLSRNEWCHCQRDSWMLLPVAAAITLRSRPASGEVRMTAAIRIIEGCLWGAAFWIKPHIALSVAPLLAVDIAMATDRREATRRSMLVILGGILMAIPGILWLVQSGAWPHFLVTQLEWNPEYLAAGRERRSWYRIWLMLIRFHPWWLVHVIAVPCALNQIRQIVRPRAATIATTNAATTMAIVYLTWLLQASLIQHAMDYIQVPPVLLGVVCIARCSVPIPVRIVRPAVLAFAGLAILASPLLQPGRLRHWVDCFSEGSSWEIRARTACGRFPDWRHLQHVVRFLEQQNVGSGDVTAFNVHCIHVYSALGILPSTRFVGVSSLLELFPSRSESIQQALHASGHRYIVVDTQETRADLDRFPWNQPVVFTAGSFQVLGVSHSDTKGLVCRETPAAVQSETQYSPAKN